MVAAKTMKMSGSGKPNTGGKVLNGVSMSQYTGNLLGTIPKTNAASGFSGDDKPGWGRG